MLRPARVEPTLIDAQTLSVAASAAGRAAIRLVSTELMPFSTDAENPPMKSTFRSRAAWSSVSAMRPNSAPLHFPAMSETGVTAIRLLMIGSPNSRVRSVLTRCRSLATRVTFSKMLRQSVSASSLTQSNRLTPTVTVRMSSCSVRTISMVSRISSPEKLSCRMMSTR
jgi:hypothetical protein